MNAAADVKRLSSRLLLDLCGVEARDTKLSFDLKLNPFGVRERKTKIDGFGEPGFESQTFTRAKVSPFLLFRVESFFGEGMNPEQLDSDPRGYTTGFLLRFGKTGLEPFTLGSFIIRIAPGKKVEFGILLCRHYTEDVRQSFKIIASDTDLIAGRGGFAENPSGTFGVNALERNSFFLNT